MSINTIRRGDRGLGKTAAGGNQGSYTAHTRAAAQSPLLAAAPEPRKTITVPARSAALLAPAEPTTWPENFGEPAVHFGEDETGRFWTQYDFTAPDGESRTVQVTSFEDTSDFTILDEPNAETDGWEEVKQTALNSHEVLESNATIVGVYACDKDSRLAGLVVSTSLGTTPPNDPAFDYDLPAGDRALMRAGRMVAGLGHQVSTMTDSDLQDALTDFVWIAKKRGFDFTHLVQLAEGTQEAEEREPHM